MHAEQQTVMVTETQLASERDRTTDAVEEASPSGQTLVEEEDSSDHAKENRHKRVYITFCYHNYFYLF